MLDAIVWLITGMWSGVAGFFIALVNLPTVLNFSEAENVMRVVFYGGSTELFFFFFDVVLVIFIIGIFRPNFLWRVVAIFEGFGTRVGRIAAWAGLAMVLQQILVVFLQSVFRVSEITVGPFGLDVTMSLGWWADGLKLYHGIIVTLCCAYTFNQKGHVRVDLVYAALGYKAKRLIDMFGALVLMAPAMVIVWLYAWFFMWRHLMVPGVSATDSLDGLLRKAAVFRWNVETTGPSPNGFNAFFLFKIFIVVFAGMMLIQAVAFFYRSFLEYREGEDSADKYLDHDRRLEEVEPDVSATPAQAQ